MWEFSLEVLGIYRAIPLEALALSTNSLEALRDLLGLSLEALGIYRAIPLEALVLYTNSL